MATTVKRNEQHRNQQNIKEKMVSVRVKLPKPLYEIVRCRAMDGAWKMTPAKFIVHILECTYRPGAEA